MSLSTKEYKVLDKGFVRYIDHMGSDHDIVKAARISYGKMDENRSIEEDRNLIRYMFSGAYECKCPHTSPYEMCELKIHIRIPMDAWRQMIRHRTANVNEYSTRYSEAIDDKQQTDSSAWRSQSKNNKQGSSDCLPISIGDYLSQLETKFHQDATDLYQYRLSMEVAREQARKDLPLSTYTEAIWKIDLHNLFHFLLLRMDSHAQKEIRDYANAIANFAKELWPLSWEAFEDYKLYAITFSRQELKLLNQILFTDATFSEIDYEDVITNKREQEAFKNKIKQILGS